MTNRWVIVIALLAASSTASAGAYGKIGGFDGAPARGPDCDKAQTPVEEEEPLWSRLSWSVATGAAWSYQNLELASSSLAVVPQVSWQFWLREGRCPGGGGALFPTHAWRRTSLAWSADLVWRAGSDDSPIDLRPAVRLARSTYNAGFLAVGSSWVPTFEIALTAGPTFDPRWSGAAVSFNVRATILSLELRVAARTEDRGQEVMLLAGITDLHGLWKIGANREI